jgi:MobA/VirD2-like, nuclease domain
MRRRNRCAGAFRDRSGAFRVIGKVTRGRNPVRLLYYLYGPGRANEHTDPHLVAGFGDPQELEPERRPDGSRDFRRLAGLLTQPLALITGASDPKPVWHCSVRAAPTDRMLSDAEWARVAAGVMDRTGLARHGDESGVRWVAVRHAPDHIHIVATLARQDGIRAKTWNDFYRVRDACREGERWFGLQSTAPADRTAARRPARAETEQAARRGWAEAPRTTLRRKVAAAVGGSGTEREFFARLGQAGVLVRQRCSTTSPGQVTGYAVGLPGHTSKDGGVIWYGGGKLAADLSLPKLRARWSVSPQQGLGPGLPPQMARAVLRARIADAAGQARDEAEFFAQLRRSGVLVRLRFSETAPGQVIGYAVALTGHVGGDGALHWYGGGRLAADLTLPQLRHRWARQRRQGRSGACRFTVPERDLLYRHAGRQAAVAAEQIRRSAGNDPNAAADAAWAAAGAFDVTADALHDPALRDAADDYGRASRPRYGRIPRRTADGDRLRALARLLALAGDLNGDSTVLAGALLANLVGLAVAVAELRQAQQHAAQAAAARKAAEHLQAAMARARSSVPWPGQAARPQRPRSARQADVAREDFPRGLRLDEAVAAAASTRDVTPGRGYQSPKRAGPRR